MSKFKVGDRVTTTATRRSEEFEDKIPPGVTFVVKEMYDQGKEVLIEWPGKEFCDVSTWWVDPATLTLADDPDEGGQAKNETEDSHAELKRVFALAVAQSQSGKGADRHGNGAGFVTQPIFTINRALGSNHGALFQVMKKVTESARLAATDRKDMAKNELLGAMVYAAAAYLLLEN